METAGLVLGVSGILIAFKGAVDSALHIESFFEEENTDCAPLALDYHIENVRLQIWGDICQISADSASSLNRLHPQVKETIVRVLGEIQKLQREAEPFVKKYGINQPDAPTLDLDDNLRLGDALPTALSKLSVKPRSRFRWTIKGKQQFESLVSRFRILVTDLQELSLNHENLRLVGSSLTPNVLAHVRDSNLLTLLGNESNGNSVIALTARAKDLRLRLAQGIAVAPTVIMEEHLRLRKSVGTLSYRSLHLPVWVEWNELESGSVARKYVERIRSLAVILERVGSTAMRLPSCYGIYEDVAWEVKYGVRRVGYVLGLPDQQRTTNPTSRLSYETDLHTYPPKSLHAIISDAKTYPIPLLGDRFGLAYALASAFYQFHSAGWLHKGLNSSSIIFFERTDDKGIEVTEPFVIGFQYSRPQQEQSHSRTPLTDQKLIHYYHEESERGFSKRLDLYSLGVILCEIGRWKLMADLPMSLRQKLSNRQAWRRYMLNSVVDDLGWRMGRKYQSAVKALLECRLPDDDAVEEFFAQEFMEKVMKPLSDCCMIV